MKTSEYITEDITEDIEYLKRVILSLEREKTFWFYQHYFLSEELRNLSLWERMQLAFRGYMNLIKKASKKNKYVL